MVSADLRNFNISVAPPGVFIAMEGIFRMIYDYDSNGNDFVDISKLNPDSEY